MRHSGIFDSITKKSSPRFFIVRLLIIGLFLSPAIGRADGPEVNIKHVQLLAKNQYYLLDAEIDYRLGQAALAALSHGVSLQWTFRVKVYRQRRYLWDKKLTDRKRRFRLRHHALMKMYQLTNLGNGRVDYYATLSAALQALGTIRDMPIINRDEISPEGRYLAVVAVSFDRNRLPVPLQFAAFLDSDWSLSSRQYRYVL